MYDMKALYEASSVEEAIALRIEHPEAQIIAGGSDVLVQMREGKRAGKELISIYMIDDLEKWNDINELRKSNPNLGVSVSVDFMLEEIAVAEGSLSKKGEFMTKYCNIKQNSSLILHQHHRRQHLQRRHICRLCLHTARL